MLVLSRKKNQKIVLADGLITVQVVEIRGDKVRLGVVAPSDIPIHREEIHDVIQKEQRKVGAA